MKHALLAASLVLVAGTTVGCGGGAPTDASEADFCKNYDDFTSAMMELGEDAEDADIVKALKEAGKTFEETGTPEDATEDERAGLEVFVQLIEDVDDDAKEADLDKMEEDLSEEEKKQFDAFTTYVSETCDEGSGEE